jgi:hypothetical protein
MNLKSLNLAKIQQFWIFQLVGWSVWVLMLVLRDLIFVPPEYIFSRALVFGFSAITAIGVTAGLRSDACTAWYGSRVSCSGFWLPGLDHLLLHCSGNPFKTTSRCCLTVKYLI